MNYDDRIAFKDYSLRYFAKGNPQNGSLEAMQ